VRLGAAAAGLALAALLGGCAMPPVPSMPSFRSEPEDPPRGKPGTNARDFDIYARRPVEPDAAIESEDDAIARVIGNPAVAEHLRQIDADYAGRRTVPLRWLVRARTETRIPKESKLAGPDREAVASALASDGSVWWVEVSSDVREAQIFYVCEVTLARGGSELTPFDEPPRRCRWTRGDQEKRGPDASY
jgi:hypothetical protein